MINDRNCPRNAFFRALHGANDIEQGSLFPASERMEECATLGVLLKQGPHFSGEGQSVLARILLQTHAYGRTKGKTERLSQLLVHRNDKSPRTMVKDCALIGGRTIQRANHPVGLTVREFLRNGGGNDEVATPEPIC